MKFLKCSFGTFSAREKYVYALLNIFSISYLESFTFTGLPWGQN